MKSTNNKTRGRMSLAAAALVGALGLQAHAASINYGDFSDIPPGTVMYTDVTESSPTNDALPMYGAPSISVNSLDFDPKTFGAVAAGSTPSVEVTDGQLNFGFMTANGDGITSLVFDESGDFTLFGNGDANTLIAAGLSVEVDITHINGVELAQPLTTVASTTFSASLVTSPGLSQPWGNVLFVDFGPTLQSAGYDPLTDRVTKGVVVVDNTLAAGLQSVPNATTALVVKKDLKIVPGLNPIPEPTTGVLLLMAAGLIAKPNRRRR